MYGICLDGKLNKNCSWSALIFDQDDKLVSDLGEENQIEWFGNFGICGRLSFCWYWLLVLIVDDYQCRWIKLSPFSLYDVLGIDFFYCLLRHHVLFGLMVCVWSSGIGIVTLYSVLMVLVLLLWWYSSKMRIAFLIMLCFVIDLV